MKNDNRFHMERIKGTLYFWYGDATNYYRSIVYGFVEKTGSMYMAAIAPRLIEGTSLEFSEKYKTEKEGLKWGIERLRETLKVVHDMLVFDNDRYKQTLKDDSNAKLKTSEHSEKAPEKPSETKKKREVKTQE
jgi:hypothetical protein